jgi:hypothetical protein
MQASRIVVNTFGTVRMRSSPRFAPTAMPKV